MPAHITPVLLIILDGFGHRDPAPDNAIELAVTPSWDRLWADRPHTLIDASADLPLFHYFRDAAKDLSRMRFGRVTWLGNIDPIRRQVLACEGVAVLPEYFVRKDLQAGRLRRVFPSIRLLYDHFRLVFRAADPRQPVFETIAEALVASPLS